jgi:hypothetical protein
MAVAGIGSASGGLGQYGAYDAHYEAQLADKLLHAQEAAREAQRIAGLEEMMRQREYRESLHNYALRNGLINPDHGGSYTTKEIEDFYTDPGLMNQMYSQPGSLNGGSAGAGGGNSTMAIGTPSPSGTGMVWSGTGWTQPGNVPSNLPMAASLQEQRDIQIQQAADKANTTYIAPSNVATVGLRDAQGNLTGEYARNALFEDAAGKAQGNVALTGYGLADYYKAEEASRALSTGEYAKINQSVVVSPLVGGSTAYQMAARAEQTGTKLDENVMIKAAEQGYVFNDVNIKSMFSGINNRETVPTRSEGEMVYDSKTGRTNYVPKENLYVKLPDAGLSYPSEEHSAVYIPGETWMNTVSGQVFTTQKSRGGMLENIAGGGGEWSAQSGAFSTKRNAAVTRTQDYKRYPKNDPRGIIESMSVSNWAEVNANWKNTSKMGSNLYGSFGGITLDGRVLDTKQLSGSDYIKSEVLSREATPKANTLENPMLFTGTLPFTGEILGGVAQASRRAPIGSGNLVNFVTPAGMNYETGDDQSIQNTGLIDYGYSAGNVLTDRRVGYEKAIPEFILVRPEPKEVVYRQAPEPSRLESEKYAHQYGGSLINNPAWDSKKEASENALYNKGSDEMFADRGRAPQFQTQTWLEPQGYELVKNPAYDAKKASSTLGAGFQSKTPLGDISEADRSLDNFGLQKPFVSTAGDRSIVTQSATNRNFFGESVAVATNVFGNARKVVVDGFIPSSTSKSSAGGNKTISDMRGWITNQTPIMNDRYNEIDRLSKGNVTNGNWTGTESGYKDVSSKINKFASDNKKFNDTINVYNAMDAQNPSMIQSPQPAARNYIGEAFVAARGFVDRNPILKMVGVVGTVGFGTSEAGFGIGTGTGLGLGELAAANPVGAGIGIGLATVWGMEASGRLGLTGDTKEYSVRNFGADVGAFAYNAGRNYQQAWNIRIAQEKNMAYTGSELPAQKRNRNEITYNPPVSELPSSKPSIIEVWGNPNPKTELPMNKWSGVELPAYIPTNPFINKNPVSNDYSNKNPNSNPNKNIYEYPTGYPTSYPNPIKNPTRNPLKNPYDTPFKNPFEPANPLKTPNVNPNTNPYTNPFQTTYPNPTMPGKGNPKIDIPKIINPFNFNFQPGSSSGAGGLNRGRGAHRETIGIRSSLISLFDTPAPRAPTRQAAPRRTVYPTVQLPKMQSSKNIFAGIMRAPAAKKRRRK